MSLDLSKQIFCVYQTRRHATSMHRVCDDENAVFAVMTSAHIVNVSEDPDPVQTACESDGRYGYASHEAHKEHYMRSSESVYGSNSLSVQTVEEGAPRARQQ
jgi:hypothetical protein